MFTAAAGLVTLVWFYFQHHASNESHNAATLPSSTTAAMAVPSCLDIPGANDTLVVLKTGSTELQDKLPVHIATTLRCYPNQLVFSDHEEQFQGISILDALEDVDAEFKENHDDFELYRRLQQYGRASLDSSELSGPVSGPSGGSGKPLNPGWRLDKWKFLPMMRKTLQLHPDKRWYIFLETDTSIFWTALLAYLAALDWTKPYYIGNQMQIAADVFAHGGSGYVISRPALEMVVKHYLENKREWENITRDHWAGDCVLGMALKAAGTPLLWAWPIWQGNDIGNMIYNRTDYNRRLWCNPTVSYHHVNPPSIKDLWIFEQRWLSENGKVLHSPEFRKHELTNMCRMTPAFYGTRMCLLNTSFRAPCNHDPTGTTMATTRKDRSLLLTLVVSCVTATHRACSTLLIPTADALPHLVPTSANPRLGWNRAGPTSVCRTFMRRQRHAETKGG